MENGVTDRLWDRDVQEFISTCRQEKLSDITLNQRELDSGQPLLTVSATYRSRTSKS